MPFEGYIFDLDGTIYLGDNLLPGAKRAITTLRYQGRRVVFLSNKPISPAIEFAQKLTRLGLPTQKEDVLNSSQATAQFLKSKKPEARIFVMGENSLIQELQDVGVQFAKSPKETDLVLVSLDRGLSYEKLHFAYHAAKSGAEIWATNPDLVCPMPDDEIIDAGASIAALEALLGRSIDGVIGKPSTIMIQTVMNYLKLPCESCLMVGDRLETDIVMGKSAGMKTALVLTGVTQKEHLDHSDIQPDYILVNVGEVLSI